MDAGEMLFFSQNQTALSAYLALRGEIMRAWPKSAVRVMKTQITFSDPRGYCFASLRRGCLVVSFGLGRPLEHPRLFAVANPAPGRYTCHVLVKAPPDIDAELMAWVRQSHDFMAGRHANSRKPLT